MKNLRKYALAAFVGVCALMAACDDNIPGVGEFEEIPLTDVTLFPALYNGITMEIGVTRNIAGMVVVTPADATDRAESFSSSNSAVATVAGDGTITATGVGTCDITISVGDFEVKFPVEVIPFIPIHIESMTLSMPEVKMALRGGNTSLDMNSVIVLEPFNANDELEFEITGPAGVITITPEGVMTSVAEGTTAVTVTSTYDATKTQTLAVEVVGVIPGYYDRTGWTMTASQDPLANITDCGQGIGAALDGDPATNIALIRPGKSSGGISNPSGSHIWFVVDMGEELFVNSFDIIHRVSGSVIQTRFWGFDEISGSNDGEDFTTIATGVALPADVSDINVLRHQVKFSEEGVTYRYIRFFAESANCFYQNSFSSNGNAVQIQELYLGGQE